MSSKFISINWMCLNNILVMLWSTPPPSSGPHWALNTLLGGNRMFFFTAYYLSNHNMQSFMALTCRLTSSDVLTQIDQKLLMESIFCTEWCCDTASYGDISPTTRSYNGDISPTSHASLTSQCLPLQLVVGRMVCKIEPSSQIDTYWPNGVHILCWMVLWHIIL